MCTWTPGHVHMGFYLFLGYIFLLFYVFAAELSLKTKKRICFRSGIFEYSSILELLDFDNNMAFIKSLDCSKQHLIVTDPSAFCSKIVKSFL